MLSLMFNTDETKRLTGGTCVMYYPSKLHFWARVWCHNGVSWRLNHAASLTRREIWLCCPKWGDVSKHVHMPATSALLLPLGEDFLISGQDQQDPKVEL